MKEFVFLLAAVLLWAIAWRVVAKFFRNRGSGGFASHAAGAAVGAALGIIGLVVLLPDREATSPATAKEVAPAPVVVNPVPASIELKPVIGADAEQFVAKLDAAIAEADAVLRRGDMQSVSIHSKRMNQLKDDGGRFGSSILDKPFGRCFAAGVDAHSLWQAMLAAAQNGGVEKTPGWIKSSAQQFHQNRDECVVVARR